MKNRSLSEVVECVVRTEFVNEIPVRAGWRGEAPTNRLTIMMVLNRTYKIPGYRISVVGRGKDNEELILKKDYYGGKAICVDDDRAAKILDYSDELEVIKKRLDNIEQFLQRLS